MCENRLELEHELIVDGSAAEDAAAACCLHFLAVDVAASLEDGLVADVLVPVAVVIVCWPLPLLLISGTKDGNTELEGGGFVAAAAAGGSSAPGPLA